MKLEFNVKGNEKKALIAALEKQLGTSKIYLGVPSCLFQVGDYIIGRNGEIEFDGDIPLEVVKACVAATGKIPYGWDEDKTAQLEATQRQAVRACISVPLDKVNIPNLEKILESKEHIIKKALGIESLEFYTDEEKITFPWFETDEASPNLMVYARFIAALCKMSITQKRVQAKEREVSNEKYTFRCFLLRLGFIGDQFKEDRKLLLKNLDGSCAFRVPKE